METKDISLAKKYVEIANKSMIDMLFNPPNEGQNDELWYNGGMGFMRENIVFDSLVVIRDLILEFRPLKFLAYYQRKQNRYCDNARNRSSGQNYYKSLFGEKSEACHCILCENIILIENVIKEIQVKYPYVVTDEEYTVYKDVPSDYIGNLASVIKNNNKTIMNRVPEYLIVFGGDWKPIFTRSEYNLRYNDNKCGHLTIEWGGKEWR